MSHVGSSRPSTGNPVLSIVVPAFNEAEGIALVLSDVKRTFPDAEVIVVDDGSSDGTGDIARRTQGVRVLRHRVNRGYGAALKTGMRMAHGELIAWMDADNEHGTMELQAMVRRLEDAGVCAVLGERPGSKGPVRALGKLLIRILLWSLQAGGMVRDVNCGLRVFRREFILPYVGLLPDGFSASMTSTMVMLERGYGIIFYPIAMRPRRGSSKVRIRHGFTSLFLMIRMIMLFAPLRIFLAAGSAAVFVGLTYGVGLAVASGRDFAAFAGILILVGVLTIFMGLIADQVSQLRLSLLRVAEEPVSTHTSEVDDTRELP